MAYKEISGNIFNTKAMAVVNTVNCVGAMGKGIALDFKLRFPDMSQTWTNTPIQKIKSHHFKFCHKRRLERSFKSRMDRRDSSEIR